MNTFVTACRREWRRLGVPEAVANEMASDLQADLAEAEADGVSPEEVLGNGYLDPESFAASWATARGVVEGPSRPEEHARRRPRTQVAAVVASGFAVLAGLFVVADGRRSSVAVAGVAFRRPAVFKMPPVPGAFVGPQRFVHRPPQPGVRPVRGRPVPRRSPRPGRHPVRWRPSTGRGRSRRPGPPPDPTSACRATSEASAPSAPGSDSGSDRGDPRLWTPIRLPMMASWHPGRLRHLASPGRAPPDPGDPERPAHQDRRTA